MKWTNTKIHVPCQAITDNTEFFLVARLIKDKADASSTVNQLKRDMRVVCMETCASSIFYCISYCSTIFRDFPINIS